MSARYTWVQWNRHKLVYDAVLAGAVIAMIALFVVLGVLTQPAGSAPDVMVLLIRATAVTAIGLLHVTLAIGPLARLSDRVAPLLYNRRHLGVTFFLTALLHAGLVLLYYGGFGVQDPLTAVLAQDGVSWEAMGFAALVIFFLMAATSHDFWLANLGPGAWKALHMAVYAAYALVVGHVAFGALQSSAGLLHPALLGVGAAGLGVLHITAGLREAGRDAGADAGPDADGFIDVGAPSDIPMDRAKVVCLKGRERIAVFRHAGGVSAVSNVCAHQAGPLGEGQVIDGCITCPWHGYQYRPEDGQSPPPYHEKIPTYDVRISAGRVLVNPAPNPPGSPSRPAPIEGGGA